MDTASSGDLEVSNGHSEVHLSAGFSPFSGQSLSPVDLQQLSPAALAYLGDAVYELHIRRVCLLPPKRIQTYHQQVVAQVRAEQQAQHLRSLLPYLSPLELEIVKRGRNAATGRPKRLDPVVYQEATSLETLVGYLYLTDPHRLAQLLTQLELASTSESVYSQ